jgi:hypothetical protein
MLTPAGIKKKVILSRRKSAVSCMAESFMTLVLSRTRSIIIPMILPGIGSENTPLITSPTNAMSRIMHN